MKDFINQYINDLGRLLTCLDTAKIADAIEWFQKACDDGRTIYVCGNGGSALIASHLVVDVLKGASLRKKARFKIIGLADNVGTLTAYGNDEGYVSVFVEQLKNFAQADDILIAISGSGNSPNVLAAVEYANQLGCRTIGLTTGDGGKLREMVGLGLLVPSHHMGRLEDCFSILTHMLAYFFIESE
jgi:D-sedoheptulose 7-phosphate isomerase